MTLLDLVFAVSCLQLQKQEQCLGEKCKAFNIFFLTFIFFSWDKQSNYSRMDEKNDHPAAKPEDELSVSRLA